MHNLGSSRGSASTAVSRVVTVVIIVVIIAIAGGAAYFASTLSSTSSTISSSSSSVSTTSSSSRASTSSNVVSSSSSSSSGLVSSSLSTVTSTSSTSTSSSCSSSSTSYSSLTSLNVAIGVRVIPEGQLAVAQNLSIFQQNGLDVSLSLVRSNAQAAALESGSIDIGVVDSQALLTTDASGGDLVAIGSGASTLPFYLMVNPSITTAQGLIGKTVAIQIPNSASDFALDSILKAIGLNRSQIQVTNFQSPNDDLTALLAGHVSAAVITPPRDIVARASGFKQLGPSAQDAGYRDVQEVIAVTRPFLNSHQVVLQNFMKSMIEATKLMIQNASGVVHLLSVFGGYNDSITNQALPEFIPSFNPTWVFNSTDIPPTLQETLSYAPGVANLNVSNVLDQQFLTSLSGFTSCLWGGSIPTSRY